MLNELTIEANEESFVIVLQHGGNDMHANDLFCSLYHSAINVVVVVVVVVYCRMRIRLESPTRQRTAPELQHLVCD